MSDHPQNNCQSCGKALREHAADGLCPRCLILGALEPIAPSFRSRKGAFCPPDIEDLQPYFEEYQIGSLIGRGGMGAVYRARQVALEREVAIKVLPLEDFEDPEATERFRQEAVTLARLNHQNIVSIYDFGERDGFFYLVMEFVEGTDLAAILQSGPVPVEKSLRWVQQICEALQFAHDQGVVHRDIKPGNILVDQSGHVKIADFGLAKVLGIGDSMLTMTTRGEQMGTPLYMSPEQRKSTADADHRADIYSIGVVLYELLTGELPSGNFPVPSEVSSVDQRCDEIVLKAMQQKPERRYQQASEMGTRVGEIGSPGTARRRSLTMWLPIAALLSAIAGLVLVLDSRRDDPGPAAADRGLLSASGVLQPDSVRAGDHAGYSMALRGERILIGAPQGMWDERFGPGYVSILEKDSAGRWQEIHRLTDPDGGESGAQFGYVNANDRHLIIAAPRDDLDGTHTNSGVVFCYDAPLGSDPRGWKAVQKLTAPAPAGREYFGVHTALDGDRLAISADWKDRGQGVVCVYEYVDGHWRLEAQLQHPQLKLFRKKIQFGNQGLALRGDMLLVGSREADRSGSLCIYEKTPGDGWQDVALLTAPQPMEDQMFGTSPHFDGDGRILVGAPGDTGEEKSAAGAVYQIAKSGDGWSVAGRLPAPVGASYFGHALATGSDQLFVGAHETRDAAGRAKSGAVYQFRRAAADPIGWEFVREFRPDRPGGFFGLRVEVDVDSGMLAIGSPRYDLPANKVGGVFLFPIAD